MCVVAHEAFCVFFDQRVTDEPQCFAGTRELLAAARRVNIYLPDTIRFPGKK